MLKRVFLIFFTLGLVGVAGYFLWKLGFVAYEKYTLQLEITKLNREIQKLQGDAQEVKKLVAYLGDKELLKIKAKEEFNLKEPGEQVVFVKGEASPAPSEKEEEKEGKSVSYWQAWWNIFFGEK